MQQFNDRRQMGRSMHGDNGRDVYLNDFVFDVRHGELRDASGQRVGLRPQAMAVLQCLARDVDSVVCKDELMRVVWPGVVVTDDSLVQCVKELRRALGDDNHRVIETEPKRGYRLVARASARASIAAAASAATAADAPAADPPFRQHIGFAASSDGTRIAWAVSGDGPVTLVRTPHWMTHIEHEWDNAVYSHWIQGLSRRYRFVRFDGRGWGLSDRGGPMGTIDEVVADLEAVVDAAGLQRFALFGRSGGGAVAIRYAARHPQRVSHLLTEGGFARGAFKRGAQSEPPELAAAVDRLIELGWGQENAASRQLITSRMFPGATAEQMRAFNHLQLVACSPRDAVAIRRRNLKYDVTADLAQIRCPTLVMHATHDALVPFEEARVIAAGIAGARLEPFGGVNHTPLPGDAAFEQVNRLIDEFLFSANEQASDANGAAARSPLRVVSNG